MNRGTRAALSGLAITALSLSVLPVGSALAATPGLSLSATSADGSAFDIDEFSAGDVVVQARRGAQNVDVDDASDLSYYWTVQAFDDARAVRVPQAGTWTQTTDANGAFSVDIPTDAPDGTYELNASLGGGTDSVASARVLRVKTGQSTLTINGGDAQAKDVGSTSTVSGTLALADGTGLANRQIALGLDRGAAGTDPGADAGFVPAANDADQSLRQDVTLTTGKTGGFSASLRDPAEDPQGTELGGLVHALTQSSTHGDAQADAEVSVDFVTSKAPAGAQVVSSPLGDGKPGHQLSTQVLVTAPDDTFDTDAATPGVQGDDDSDPDVVQGLRYNLALNHGFFTTEQGQVPTEGALVGNLVSLGSKAQGYTNSSGQFDVFVGIGRDKGFDVDGSLAATVTGQVGGLKVSNTANWNTADPLNGRVALRYTPRSRQEGPVKPALVDARVYFDAFTLDQFGNPVQGHTVDLTYGGYLADYDYSEETVTSDFDTYGDFWLASFVPGTLKVTGTWEDAPTTKFDASGAPHTGSAAVRSSVESTYYRVNFAKSRFAMTSTAKDVVPSGGAVSHTVRVTDQHGNPVRGATVRFFRTGPDRSRGEAVRTANTNVRGEASYTFVTAKVGRSTITAEVTDGVSRKLLRAHVRVGQAIKARISKGTSSGRYDRLKVKANRSAAGAKVFLYRVDGARQVKVKAARLDARGRVAFKVRDRNGRTKTTYVATVRSTSTTAAATTRRISVR